MCRIQRGLLYITSPVSFSKMNSPHFRLLTLSDYFPILVCLELTDEFSNSLAVPCRFTFYLQKDRTSV